MTELPIVTRLSTLMWSCLTLGAVAVAAAQDRTPPSYPEAVRDLQPPAKPAHRTWFADAPMPASGQTAYMDDLNKILGNCIDAEAKGKTKGTWAALRRSEYFGMYAVWGLTSPDSKHADSDALGDLLCTWMDERYPAGGGDFKAGWKAWYLYGPVVEISARAALRKLVGADRLNRAIKRVLGDARDLAERRWPNAVEKSVEIVNFGGHGDAAALTLGWLLAREFEPELAPGLFQRAAFAMRMMDWHMRPNGAIRYLYNPDCNEPRLVAETMYYHNINTRAIYCTGGSRAMSFRSACSTGSGLTTSSG